MKELALRFDCVPLAIQSVRSMYAGGFIRHYQPKKNTTWKQFISMSAREQLPDGFKPFDGFVMVTRALFVFPPLKTFKKQDMQMLNDGYLIRKNTKPDLSDNLFKGLMDALAGIVFDGDHKICEMNGAIGKFYGIKPFIELEFTDTESKFVIIEREKVIPFRGLI